MIILLLAVILFVVVGVAFNYIFRTISYSFYKNTKPVDEIDDSVKEIWFGDEGEVSGYVRSTDYSVMKPAILFFGGSTDIAYNAALTYGPLFEDYVLFTVDYPGTHKSRGKMNLTSIQYAAVSLYEYARKQEYVDQDHIQVIGYSYGSGIATYAAAKEPCEKVVLVAPYRDVIDLYNQIIPVFHSPLGWFVTDNIDAKQYAKSVEEKVLIVTSDGDKTMGTKIPKQFANYFADVAVKEYSGIEHDKYFEHGEVVDAIKEFLE